MANPDFHNSESICNFVLLLCDAAWHVALQIVSTPEKSPETAAKLNRIKGVDVSVFCE